MKKEKPSDSDMLDEYDFRGGIRGKYAARYAQGTNVVLLDPDVAAVFKDSASVNRALRALGGIINEHNKTAASPRSRRASVKTS